MAPSIVHKSGLQSLQALVRIGPLSVELPVHCFSSDFVILLFVL